MIPRPSRIDFRNSFFPFSVYLIIESNYLIICNVDQKSLISSPVKRVKRVKWKAFHNLQSHSRNSGNVQNRHYRMVNEDENFKRMIQGEVVFVDFRHIGGIVCKEG